MPYEAAKCPNCGGELQLDNSMETGFCSYCGGKLIVREAVNQNHDDNSSSSIDDALLYGQQCLDAKNWNAAYLTFSNVIAKDPDNFKAWLGCLTAITHNFLGIDFISVTALGINVESIIRNCLRYAPPEQEDEIRQRLKNMMSSMQEDYEKSQRDGAQKKKIINVCLWASLISTVLFISISVFLFGAAAFRYMVEGNAILETVFAFLSLAMAIICLGAFIILGIYILIKNFRDGNFVKYIRQINSLLNVNVK